MAAPRVPAIWRSRTGTQEQSIPVRLIERVRLANCGPRCHLNAKASAAMRDRLAAEIAGLGSVDVAVEWARRSIAAKNTLTAADASSVETAFRDRMQVLESHPEASAEDQVVGSPGIASPPGSAIVQDPSLEETQQAAVGRHKGSQRRRSRASDEVKAEHIDKSAL